MGFSLEKSTGGNSQTQKDWPKGVYIDRIKITVAENNDVEWNDCNLKIEGDDVSGRGKFPKRFFLGGKHKKDGNKFVDWGTTKGGVQGGSWKVRDFLIASGIENKQSLISENGSITDEVLADLLDREVYMLQYDSNGKYSRETWFYFESANNENAIKDLLALWNKYDNKPSKYLHQVKTEVQNKKLNTMWDNLPGGDNTAKSELDAVLG